MGVVDARRRVVGPMLARRLSLLWIVAGLVVLAVIYRDQLDVPRIRAFVDAMGPWGPALFVLVYFIAPALLLPGLPLDLAAGILFGPLWGTVYVMVGGTGGAT